MKSNPFVVVLGVLAIIALFSIILCWPFIIVFALNTLFPLLSIPYSFLVYISVVILNLSTFGGLAMAIRSNSK